ncbi:MAG: transposase [Nitrospinota bacterium]
MRRRIHPAQAPGPGRAVRGEHEYKRLGALAYVVAWDVRRAHLFGRVLSTCTMEAFDGFVAQVMAQAPYACAERVFWVVDNGTTHRGQRAIDRLQSQWPNLLLVHLPIHASWLNQVEIFFSVLQRKVLTPDDSACLEERAGRILKFQVRYQQIAKPSQWTFTRKDLAQLMARLVQGHRRVQRVA